MDVSFLVSCEGGKDLGVYRVENADKKEITDFCNELNSGSKKLRSNKDTDHKKRGLSLILLPTL